MFQDRKHHLPPEAYRGKVAVTFTACLNFNSAVVLNEIAAEKIREKIENAGRRFACEPYAWCLMPDHLHLLLIGKEENSDTRKAMVWFKQQTGYWLSRNMSSIEWQKDFYDHIVRTEENLAVQGAYVLDNPVRRGMIRQWWQYKWSGGTLFERLRAQYLNETER